MLHIESSYGPQTEACTDHEVATKALALSPARQVLLEKNVKLRTIVNKLGSIDNEYRVFDMEVIAGDEDTVTEVQQQGHRFQLDFRKVLWRKMWGGCRWGQ